jgi:hypothetical protein
VRELRRLFGHAPTQKNIEGTRWAGYQAIVEYLDHFSPAKEEATQANRVIRRAPLRVLIMIFVLV